MVDLVISGSSRMDRKHAIRDGEETVTPLSFAGSSAETRLDPPFADLAPSRPPIDSIQTLDAHVNETSADQLFR